MKKLTVLFVLCLCSVLATKAQEVSLDATVNKSTISEDGFLRIEFTLENAKAKIEIPDMKNFKVVQGPAVGSSTTIVNGRVTKSYTNTYVLKPLKTGTLTIPSAKAVVKNKTYTSDPIRIKVTSAGENPQPDNNSDFFISVQTDKRTAYKGEPILATVKLYSRYQSFRGRDLQYPELEGFWSEEIVPENRDWERETEIVNGRKFLVMVLKHYVLFPQRSGNLNFGSVEFSATVSASLFGSGKNVSTRSTPISFNIKPLPSPPADDQMMGTFNQLDIKSEISRSDASVNQSVELKVNFIGNGNLSLLDEPEFDFPESFEIFDTKVADNFSIRSSGVSGEKSFTFIMIPRKKGAFTIPATTLTYFNSRSKEYREYTIGPFELNITPATGKNAGNLTYNSQTDVNILNQDIRGIISETSLKSRGGNFFGSITFYGLLSAPILLFLVLFLYDQKQRSEEQDVTGSRRRKAGGRAFKQLRKLRSGSESMDDKKFYSGLSSAIYNYLSAKFNLQTSELNKPNIEKALSGCLDEGEKTSLTDVLQTCEMAQYAPVGGGNKIELIERTEKLIKKVEENQQ